MEKTYFAVNIAKTKSSYKMRDQWMNDCVVTFIKNDQTNKNISLADVIASAVFRPLLSHMHMKSETKKPFIEDGSRFHTDANKKARVFLDLMFFGFSDK